MVDCVIRLWWKIQDLENVLMVAALHATLLALSVCDNGLAMSFMCSSSEQALSVYNNCLNMAFIWFSSDAARIEKQKPSFDQYGWRVNSFLAISVVLIAIRVIVRSTTSRRPVEPPNKSISLLLPPIEREIPRRLLVTEAAPRDPLVLFQSVVAPVIHIRISQLWL